MGTIVPGLDEEYPNSQHRAFVRKYGDRSSSPIDTYDPEIPGSHYHRRRCFLMNYDNEIMNDEMIQDIKQRGYCITRATETRYYLVGWGSECETEHFKVPLHGEISN